MARSAKYTFHYMDGKIASNCGVERSYNDGESVKEYDTLEEAVADVHWFFDNHPLGEEDDEEETDLIIRRTASNAAAD